MTPRLLFLASGALIACSPKPASLEIVQPPELLLSAAPQPAPKVVVKDRDGNVLTDHPPIKLFAEPTEVMMVDGSQLVALGDGQAELSATMASPALKASAWIKVRMVKRTVIECEPSCTARVGEVITVRATSMGTDEKFPAVCEPVLSGPALGFEETSPGKLKAVRVGVAKVRCGGTEIELRANPKVDKLALSCPNGDPRALCVIDDGTRIKIPYEASGGGATAVNPPIQWSSSNTNLVTFSGGELIADGPGTVEITATSDGVVAKLTVKIVPPTQLACSGKPPRHMYTFLDQSKRRSRTPAQGITLLCESPRSEACLDAHITSPIEVSAQAIKTALGDCCCEIDRARVTR